jgi:mRNA interferase MazF
MSTAPTPKRGEVWLVDFDPSVGFTFIAATARNGLSKDSGADAFQVKSISQSRFVRSLGMATSAELDSIATAVSLVVGKP